MGTVIEKDLSRHQARMIGTRSPLVERSYEEDLLECALTQLSSGRGSLLVFEGPPGSGRTHLLRTLAERAGVGARVLPARAAYHDQTFPFGLIRQLVERWLTGAAPAAAAEAFAGSARLATQLFDYAGGELPDRPPAPLHEPLHALYWLLRNIAQRQPLVLAVDDVHWADMPSLHLMRYLAGQLDDTPVLVLATALPDEHSPSAGLLHEAYTAPRSRVTALRPLTEDGVRAVAEETLGQPVDEEFASVCHELTAGNPCLLHELLTELGQRRVRPVAAVAADVRGTPPRSIVRLVRSWLLRLPQPAIRLVRALAVLDGGAHLRHAAEVAGLTQPAAADAVRTLSLMGLLVEGEPLRLAQPLVRTALYHDLPARQRVRAHHRMARLLAADGMSGGQVAEHLLSTRPAGNRWVVEALRGAAAGAVAAGRPERAVVWLRRAMEEPPRHDERFAVLAELGAAERRARDSMAIQHLSAALAGADDPAVRRTVRLELGLALTAAGRYSEALDVLEGEERVGAPALPAEAEFLAVAQLSPGTRTRAEERLKRLPGSRIDPAVAACWAAERMAGGGTAAEVALLAERVLHLREPAAVDSEAYPACAAAWALIQCDRHAAAERVIREVRREDRSDLVLAATMAECLQARLLFDYGRLAEAETLARAVLDRTAGGELVGLAGRLAAAILVDSLRERGWLEEAGDRLRAIDLDHSPSGSLAVIPLLHARGRIRMAQGDFGGAVADLREIDVLLDAWSPHALAFGTHRCDLAVTLAQLGETDEAGETASRAIAGARRFGAERLLAQALRAGGLITAGAAGLELLEEAVALLEGTPYQLEYAAALVDLGGALRRVGRRAEARRRLEAAIELSGRCGGAAQLERARTELTVAGGRARAGQRHDLASLTPSEHRVVRMAADGMRNDEIARTLFVSVKTVEWHLSHAYPKLGVRNRGELTRALSSVRPTGSKSR